MFQRIFPACLVALSMLLSVPAVAEMNPEGSGEMTVDQLDAIAGYLVSDQFVVSRLRLRKLDKDPVPELITIARDGRKKDFVRERAIKSMSLFRDKRVLVVFKEMLKERPDQFFTTTVMSYMEAFGEDGVKDIAPYLADASADVRLTTVKALGLFGGAEGYDLLAKHAAGEQNPQVLNELRTYVQQ